MTVKDLTTAEANALSGTRFPRTGMLAIPAATQPHWTEVIRNLKHLDLASASDLMVKEEATAANIQVMPGRCQIGGKVLSYAGGTVDLSAYNNDTAYVWAYDNSGTLTISAGTDAVGWPATQHIKLGEVTLSAGEITAVTDRRFDDVLMVKTPGYVISLETQGDTGSASRIHVQAIGGTDYLRVRVCDDGDYDAVTNASIAAAGNTTLVETITAGEDLVFQSHTDGLFEIDLTDATAETVTVRIGPAPMHPINADYSAELDVTHAAP